MSTLFILLSWQNLAPLLTNKASFLKLRFELVLMIAYVSCSSKQERVDQGIETEGSNLSGVSAKCVWDDLSRPPEDEEDSRSICIGSQPRRLSDKGVLRSALKPQLLNHFVHNGWGFLLSAVHEGIISCCCLCVDRHRADQGDPEKRTGV